MLVRKKGTFEARQFTESNYLEFENWNPNALKSFGSTSTLCYAPACIKLHSNYKWGTAGRRIAYAGDWIIKNSKGKFKIYSHNQFRRLFEEVL